MNEILILALCSLAVLAASAVFFCVFASGMSRIDSVDESLWEAYFNDERHDR